MEVSLFFELRGAPAPGSGDLGCSEEERRGKSGAVAGVGERGSGAGAGAGAAWGGEGM